MHPSSSLTTSPRITNIQRIAPPSYLFSDHAACCSLCSLFYGALPPGLICWFLQCLHECYFFHVPFLGYPTHATTPSWIKSGVRHSISASQGQEIHVLKLPKSLSHHEVIIHEWGHQPCLEYLPKLLWGTHEGGHQERTTGIEHYYIHFIELWLSW